MAWPDAYLPSRVVTGFRIPGSLEKTRVLRPVTKMQPTEPGGLLAHANQAMEKLVKSKPGPYNHHTLLAAAGKDTHR